MRIVWIAIAVGISLNGCMVISTPVLNEARRQRISEVVTPYLIASSPMASPSVIATPTATPQPALSESPSLQVKSSSSPIPPLPQPTRIPDVLPQPLPTPTPWPQPTLPPAQQRPLSPQPSVSPTSTPSASLSPFTHQVKQEYVLKDYPLYFASYAAGAFFDPQIAINYVPGEKVLLYGGDIYLPHLGFSLCCIGAEDRLRIWINETQRLSRIHTLHSADPLIANGWDMTHYLTPGVNQVRFRGEQAWHKTITWMTPLYIRIVTAPPSHTPLPGMTFAYQLPGEMVSGSLAADGGPNDERPRNSVGISGFYLQTTEVTQKQWWDVMGRWPGEPPSESYGLGDDYPMYNVSWEDVQVFLATLNAKGVGTFRLPTEMEWEYSARMSSGDAAYACGADGNCMALRAWYADNSGGKTHPVATTTPSVWGALPSQYSDFHGNVAEWVSDWYGPYVRDTYQDPTGPESGTERVHRGGSWQSPVFSLRTAARDKASPETRSPAIGFRLVWEPPGS